MRHFGEDPGLDYDYEETLRFMEEQREERESRTEEIERRLNNE